MEIFVGLCLIILVAVIVAIIAAIKPRANERGQYKYWLKTGIMSTTEQAFYKTLTQAVGDQYRVFPQVRLSALLNEKVKGQNWKAALWKINQKSVDFVICYADTLKPVIVIELDDYTHERADRRQRDYDLDQIFTSVNFPLVRFKVGASAEEVAVKLHSIL